MAKDTGSSMNRREFSKTIAGGLLGATVMGPAAISVGEFRRESSPARKPNFIFLCSDQHSARFMGAAGHPLVRTPNLDRIASKGVAFTSAYCSSPLCVPGRSSMMTGMYPSDVNSFCNSTVYDGSYPTWGKRLRDASYHCWAVGKQDLNPAYDLGFTGANVENGHARKPDITSLFRRPVGYRVGEREGIDGGSYLRSEGDSQDSRPRLNPGRDARDTRAACDFLRNEAVRLSTPWAAFIGLREPHPEWSGLKEYYDYYLPLVAVPTVSLEELEQLPLPYQAMRNFKRISTPIPEERIRRAIAAYLSMVTELDSYVGEIYRCLEETGQIDNTYFIYTSDHGESLGEHGMWLKNNLYECATRIPLVISGPKLPRGETIDTPVSHVDLVATMIEWAGMPTPAELRGTSLSPLIDGRSGTGPAFVYAESHSEGNPTGSCMVRKGPWKLIHFSYYEDYLFNLEEDPEEKHNRAGDPALKGVIEELRSTLRRQVDPEEITERAFAAQKRMLDGFAERMSEEELFELMRSRLGDGQARVIAKRLKA